MRQNAERLSTLLSVRHSVLPSPVDIQLLHVRHVPLFFFIVHAQCDEMRIEHTFHFLRISSPYQLLHIIAYL